MILNKVGEKYETVDKTFVRGFQERICKGMEE